MDANEYQESFGWPLAQAPTFEPVLGDIFEVDWTDGDFILCNGSCFNITIMEAIYAKSLKCKKGTWFLTMSKRLPKSVKVTPEAPATDDLHWEHILGITLQMSWGPATLNLQRKRTHPVTAPATD